jgi:hypothetical protein
MAGEACPGEGRGPAIHVSRPAQISSWRGFAMLSHVFAVGSDHLVAWYYQKSAQIVENHRAALSDE